VYDAIWESVERCTRITSQVRPANRINFAPDEHFKPEKPRVQQGDLPELILQPVPGAESVIADTTATRLTRQYQWILTSGEQSVQRVFELEFALTAVTLNMITALAALTWNDRKFVKRVQVVTGDYGKSNKETARNVEGWIYLMTFSVDYYFITTDLYEIANT